MFKCHNGVKKDDCNGWVHFVLLFWCHRKRPLTWSQTCRRGVILPFSFRKTTFLLWTTSTSQVLPKGQQLDHPWWPQTSLLWQTQQMKVKCHMVQHMPSLTTSTLGLYLSENSMLRLNNIKKMQKILPSVFPEHVACRAGRGKVNNHTAEEGTEETCGHNDSTTIWNGNSIKPAVNVFSTPNTLFYYQCHVLFFFF